MPFLRQAARLFSSFLRNPVISLWQSRSFQMLFEFFQKLKYALIAFGKNITHNKSEVNYDA
jgi:hypothetical protein